MDMEDIDSVTKYVVYSKKLDQYLTQTRNIHADFTESLISATIFELQRNAVDRALVLSPEYETIACPVTIDMYVDKTDQAIEGPKRIAEAKVLAARLEQMTDAEEDALTNAQLSELKRARVYLRERGLL